MNKITVFFFPLGTKRRKNFDLALIGFKVLFCDGWKSFLARYKAYKLYCQGIKPDNKKYYFQLVEDEKKNHLDTIKKEIDAFEYKPTISIIMPTWNTPAKILKLAIKSVKNQMYSNWELCIADGNSNADTKKILQQYVQNDKRIKVKLLTENLNISENSNQAISLATGEYIGLLDHDDELTFDALYEVVKLLQEHPEADLIYSDEDKIDEKGNRSSFFFKPDWSPDLLLSQNYISHFGIYRKSIVDRIGGFRGGYEGSQDYDLVLRFTELTDNIFHIPQILYHWRMVEGSVAAYPNAKQYAYDSAMRALSDAMDRRKICYSDIEMNFKGSYRIRYEVKEDNTVTIIIPTKNHLNILEKCINSILEKTDYKNYEILIVNNRSYEKKTQKYLKKINENPKINVIDFDHEFNFSAINNYAAKFAKGSYLLFLNNDTEIISCGWITSMVEYCQKDAVGAVGAKLLYPDDTIQHAGIILSSTGLILHSHKKMLDRVPGYFNRLHIAQNISAVTGACLMVKKTHFLDVKGFDDKNLATMFNDIDLCLKLHEKGYLNIYTPFVKLIHHESVSRGCKVTPPRQNELNFIRQKWQKIFDHDPFYNKNLTQTKDDYSLRY